jgi:DNA-binding response OmpR family regulator
MMKESASLLIVEDDPETASLLETFFKTQGYRVHCIRHGEEAEPLAVERRPDLVLLDIRLPGMDGFEVARRLHANRQTTGIPVLMLTDLHERGDKLKGLGLGAEDYIAKPFDLQELGLRVRNSVERSRRKRTVNPVTELPEGKPVEEAIQRLLRQPEWSIVTIQIAGLDSFRASRGFPVADDLVRAVGSLLQTTAAQQLKVGVQIGHLSFDELVILSDLPSLLEFAKTVAPALRQKYQSFHPVFDGPDKKSETPPVSFQFRFLSSTDGSFPTWDALQSALDQTPSRTL